LEWDAETGAYRVTGYSACSAILRGTGWSSDPRRSPLAAPDVRDMPTGNLLFTDPPDHTRLRRLLTPGFTPRSVRELRPRVAAIVDSVLTQLRQDADDLVVDLVSEFAYPITLAVLAELLDIGTEGARLFAELTRELVRMLEVDAGPEDLLASALASTEMTIFLTPIIAERRRTPGDDLISALLALLDTPDGLSLNEVLATCILLMIAGHETTANLIANAAHALITRPEQIPHLIEKPERAIEELLRVHGPAKLITRTALADHNVAGLRIDEGQAVLLDLRQANLDPRRWLDPGRLDLTRAPTGHLAFGTGIHFCLGAALARTEAAEALHRLFTSHPDMTLPDPDLRWRNSTAFQSLLELPVGFRSSVGT
jgi:cytochrome P450